MATYKTKVKDLKNIANKTDIGGAPFWGDDILGLQINAKADFINTHENLRRRLPIYEYYRGSNPAEKMHGMGLILSGLNYNNATASAVTVSSGYILLEGEICYYAGGTFDCSSGSAQKFLYLGKGAALTESRVFADGASKEFKIEYGVNATLSETGANGPITEPLTSADLAKDFIFIVLGAGATFAGQTEKYFTTDAAHGLINLGLAANYPAFTPFISMGANWSSTNSAGNFLAGSRVIRPGVTQIYGTCQRNVTGGSGNEIIANLAPSSFDVSTATFTAVGNAYPLQHMAKIPTSSTVITNFNLSLTISGQITISPVGGPSTNFPTNTVWLNIGATIYDTVAMQDSYTFNNKFMDITP